LLPAPPHFKRSLAGLRAATLPHVPRGQTAGVTAQTASHPGGAAVRLHRRLGGRAAPAAAARVTAIRAGVTAVREAAGGVTAIRAGVAASRQAAHLRRLTTTARRRTAIRLRDEGRTRQRDNRQQAREHFRNHHKPPMIICIGKSSITWRTFDAEAHHASSSTEELRHGLAEPDAMEEV
jgi:hypothetical protein